MADRARVQEVNEAAERAAEGGDFARAAELLGQAAGLLEGDGEARGDLANTLNNLGVACERLGRLDDAEAAYRRACAIAGEAYPADHPFVVRSTENLHDFLAARGATSEPAAVSPPAPKPPAPADPPGQPAATQPPSVAKAVTSAPPEAHVPPAKPATVPPPAPKAEVLSQAPAAKATPQPATAPAARPAATPAPAAKPAVSPTPPVRPATPVPAKGTSAKGATTAKSPVGDLPLAPPVHVKNAGAEAIAPAAPTLTVQNPKASRVPLIFGIVFLLLVAVAFAGARGCGAGLGLVSVTMDGAREAPDAPAPVTPEPAAPAAATADDDDAVTPDDDDREPTADAVVSDTAAVAESLALVDAKVCRDFVPSGAEWQCTEVGTETTPGVVVYYTRIRTPTTASVEHRWYFDDTLLQSVSLDVGANSNAGYRTYSRDTIPPDGTGTWRVELRSASGAVLHQAEFRVR